MIEKRVKDYLESKMELSVYLEKPEEEPGKYILVEKIGGGEKDCISNARIAIQTYANSLYAAAKYNETVKDSMKAAVSFSAVCVTDYNFTDTTKKKYRYQAVFDIYY